MDAVGAHRFHVLLNLRKEYRDLHRAASSVIAAWNNGEYDFRGEGDDPISGLEAALTGSSSPADGKAS